MSGIPEIRLRRGNDGSTNREGAYVLYWMTAFRRLGWNFALEHAAERARELGKPLVILEALRVDYPWASHRLHRFILEGMAERHARLRGSGAVHHPFVERFPGEGKGLLASLGERAALVVGDDCPTFFLPRMVSAAGRALRVRLDLVDSNGLLPLRAPDRTFTTAHSFRRHVQSHLPEHLGEGPLADPLGGLPPAEVDLLPDGVRERWPAAGGDLLAGGGGALDALPLDSSVGPVGRRGGTAPGRAALERFLQGSLHRYATDRSHPDREATSGLSPYLHFGNLSAHEVFGRVVEMEGWTPLRLSHRADGARSGWWGMGEGAEAFLDQLVTWRELGFNTAFREEGYDRYEALPEWARTTLEEHEGDPREHLYSLGDLREARTADPLWNAAQRELLEEGVIHNSLRMLWGKRILEWTASAREALDAMLQLNEGLALDGRDPNSVSGIFWCLGRYDRGWPERTVFGKVRSMTSASSKRKWDISKYMERFGSERG